MAGDVKSRRRYDSPRRQAQAEATRRDILAAAQRLFEANGYPATTMAEIAKEAGVALKTVYLAFQTKSGLLRALWNLLLRGDESDRPVAERDWYRAVLEEDDPERRLRLNARNSATGKQRISAILEVIRTAAAVDPDVATLWQRIQSDYYANQRAIVEQLHERAELKLGLGVREATDILWTINHPNTWQLLVVERGWTPDQYERWTGDLACAQLLDHHSAASHAPKAASHRSKSNAGRRSRS
jgi:AcrR family transcriptional regulator